MKIDGACHCGAINYAAEIDPSGVRLCHCHGLPGLSGSAFRVTVAARMARSRCSRGSRRSTSRRRKAGQARACLLPGLRHAHLRHLGRRRPEEIRPPRRHHPPARRIAPGQAILVRSALDWAMDLQAIQRFEKQ